MNRFFSALIGGILFLAACAGYAQQSSNVVDYQVTYDVATDTYTASVVPRYNIPNTNNAGTNERGSTAQFTLKVPSSFTITNITDVKGTWDKTPLRLGPGNPQQDWSGSGLDPAINYYIIGKSPTETNYGSFTSGTPVALFTFQGNGCFGPISPLEPGNPFIAQADQRFSLNVANSFYSLSGQPSGGNQNPLEQFRTVAGPAAQCSTLQANPDSQTLTAGTSSTVAVLGNDTRNGQPVSTTNVTVTVNTPSSGTATVNPDGTITYVPAPGFSGPISFAYTICDKLQPTVCSTASLSLTVNAVLVATADQAVTPASMPVSVSVLANDIRSGLPASATNVTVSLSTPPATGTATVNANGTILYTPATGFSGAVSFTYTVCDIAQPAQCSSAPVNLTISSALQANPDSQTLTAGTSSTIAVLGNDSRNGQPVSNTSVTVIVSTPNSGTATVNPDGTITYVPAPGFSGPVSFTYTVCDKLQPAVCSSALINLTVSPVVILPADLLITKQVSQSVVAVGSNVTFTITVQNLGPGNAIDVSVLDTLTKNSSVQILGAATPSKGTFNIATGVWTVGNLSASETATLTLSVQTKAEGVLVNVASVTATGSQDPNPNNNEASSCASVPVKLCPGDEFIVSVPDKYQNVSWYKDGAPYATGNSVTITQLGIYSVTSTDGGCPLTGCCPIIVEEGDCCPVDKCVPFVIKKTKSRL